MSRHPDDIDPVALLAAVEATAHKPISRLVRIMKRITALLITLAALVVVIGGSLLATAPASTPQASQCYKVVDFWPYPHYVWYCNTGGGGSW